MTALTMFPLDSKVDGFRERILELEENGHRLENELNEYRHRLEEQKRTFKTFQKSRSVLSSSVDSVKTQGVTPS